MTSKMLFWLSLCLFIVHQYLQKILAINISYIDNYLDPLLLMPILLYLVRIERQLVLGKSYQLPKLQIFGFVVLISILAEIIFPFFNPVLVADIWDVFFYAAGAVLYTLAEQANT